MNHEEAFVKGFVEVNRRERFLGFLGDGKKRRKLIGEFDHLKSGFLDREFMIPLRGAGSLPPNVFAALRKMGAPETNAGQWVADLMGGRKNCCRPFESRGTDLFCPVSQEGWHT
jgi:hypothetical protein